MSCVHPVVRTATYNNETITVCEVCDATLSIRENESFTEAIKNLKENGLLD